MYDMSQFKVHKNQYGNMYIYERLLGYPERLICLRQWNSEQQRYI